MYYPRYFKLGQDITLNRVFLDPGKQNQTDSLSGQIASCDNSGIIIHFPYNKQNDPASYPFFPGMPFKLHAEYHGLGVEVAVSFEDRMGSGLIRLLPSEGLQFYYLRKQIRSRKVVWFGYKRSKGSLLSMRRQWRRHVDQFQAENDPSSVTAFAKQQIELGDSGINLTLAMPIETSELVLIYLALDDGKPLICALAEVVRVNQQEKDGAQEAGLHFINILEEDQLRIKKFLRKAG